jgi:16S rRNA (guanine1207-N2)-methyltransferase
MPKESSRAVPHNTDLYLNKIIDFRCRKHSLQFRASQSLFSSHEIDRGTRLLLRTLEDVDLQPNSKILDLGCGYGVIGLSLAVACGADAHLVDRDALAVQYTRDNAELNGMERATVYGSLGFDDVTDTGFDLIVSNLPGKAGGGVLAALLSAARHFLKPGGIMAVVVVSALAETIEPILRDSLDVEILLNQPDRGHTVFQFTFRDSTQAVGEFHPAIGRGVYDREVMLLPIGKTDHRIETARGLPEFDTLSYQTRLLIESLMDQESLQLGNATIINPGQGQIAVAVHHILHPGGLTLVDRDLLALRYSLKNLSLNGYRSDQISTVHSPSLGDVTANSSDLTVLPLRGDDPPALPAFLVEEGLRTLSLGGILVVGGSSTVVTRLEKKVRAQKTCRVADRKRRRGSSVLVLRNE